MHPDRKNYNFRVNFTEAQKNAVQQVRDEISKQGSIIIVEGLSGLGKSIIIESLEKEIGQHAGRVINYLDLMYGTNTQDLINSQGSIVTTTIPVETISLLETITRGRPNLNISRVILKGMNLQEIEAYIQSRKERNKATLQIEEIKHFSLGIPLLAKQLLTPGLTIDAAAQIAADHLIACLGPRGITELKGNYDTYLNVVPNSHILEELKKRLASRRRIMTETRVYENLRDILLALEKVRSEGKIEESPLFVCVESEKIYDHMMNDRLASIDIYAPNISPQDYARIIESFGIEYNNINESKATRLKIFKANKRKTGVLLKSDSTEVFAESEAEHLPRIAQDFQKKVNNGEIPVQKNAKSWGSVCIHAHEHRGMPFNVVRIGWLTESLLQQRNIAYIAKNHLYGSLYVYHPNEKRIEHIQTL